MLRTAPKTARVLMTSVIGVVEGLTSRHFKRGRRRERRNVHQGVDPRQSYRCRCVGRGLIRRQSVADNCQLDDREAYLHVTPRGLFGSTGLMAVASHEPYCQAETARRKAATAK